MRRLRYDGAGQLARIDDRTRGASEYGYDPVGRLLKAVTPDLTEIFAFDPAGNPIDAAKIPPYPDGLETEHERTARYARDAAEDAEWMRAHPGQKPFRLKGARRVWGGHRKGLRMYVEHSESSEDGTNDDA
ncbi:RHS repeat domain-containing protein [Paraburkholderia hospita]|uniref:RHS repeat domain-containing protein n=1 Tax=Paraburkholderia TaxID=1822464 RepID=UPI0009A7C9EF|nr:RHS repeat domain-containing protein [Paraburkholderia hospita]SKC92791.1 YD repeat-containing protein [Paraburkholderia hospita]